MLYKITIDHRPACGFHTHGQHSEVPPLCEVGGGAGGERDPTTFGKHQAFVLELPGMRG